MKAKGLIATVVLASLLSACGSSCDQQAYAEKLQQVSDAMLVIKHSNAVEIVGEISYEHLALLETAKQVSADDLDQSCDLLDDMLADLQ